jgi:hypothetical protein
VKTELSALLVGLSERCRNLTGFPYAEFSSRKPLLRL